jgi:protein TonB
MNTATIEHRSSTAIWASCSLGLHILILVGFNLYQPDSPSPAGETTAKIRIFSNPTGSKDTANAPRPIQTQSAKPDPIKPAVRKITVPDPLVEKPDTPVHNETPVLRKSTMTGSESPTAADVPASLGDDRQGGSIGEGSSTTHADDFDRSITKNLQPLKRIEPVYPKEAALNGTEGWAIFTIDITESGEVENIKLVESFPSRIFERESRRALANWKYQPQVQNGKAQRIENHTVKIIFKLEG